jgi:Zn-dependent protease
MNANPTIPYLIDFANLAQIQIDDFIAFILGVLLAALINAEAQAFTATLLGDQRPDTKDRFHFNAFLHLDLLGSLAFLLGGFGWPRQITLDTSKFAFPRLYDILTRLSGPVGNFLMAGIAGSLAGILATLNHDPRIFLGVIGVNVTVAVYNLIPIPPLALGTIWVELLPETLADLKKWLQLAGPWVIIAILFYDRIYQVGIFSRYLNPLVAAVYGFVTG